MAQIFTIIYCSQAQNDMNEIFEYIARDNKKTALQILDEFDLSISQLETNPFLGQIPKSKQMEKLGYRYLNIKNYIVLYAVRANRVEIQRIIYGWNNWRATYLDGAAMIHKEVIDHLKSEIAIKY